MPEEPQKKPQTIDYFGAATFIAAAVGLMLAVTFFNVWLLIACLCFLSAFLLRQKQAAAPFIPLNLFRNRPYRRGLFMGAFNASINFGVMMTTPILLRHVYELDAGYIGWLLFPGALVSSLLGYFGGKMMDKKDSGWVLKTAVALTGTGLLLISSWSGHFVAGIAVCLILTNSGYMMMQPALAKWVSGTLAEGQTGIGMGVYSLNNFMSTSLIGAAAAKALEHVGPVAVNPFAAPGMAGVYSNVYFGFFILALVQAFLVYRMRRARHRAREG